MNYETLCKIQNELKIGKEKKNEFGGFNFRSATDILENIKPILQKYNASIVLNDSLEYIGDRYYVKATATIIDNNSEISTTAYAREPLKNDRMNESQTTGSASSYARKYALQGLLAIDDSKLDPDSFDTTKTIDSKLRARLEMYIRQLKENGEEDYINECLQSVKKSAKTYEDLSEAEIIRFGKRLSLKIQEIKYNSANKETEETKKTENKETKNEKDI